MKRAVSCTSLLLLLLFAGILYGTLLNRAPVHLNQDEVGFSLNAYSIAKTGLDDNGRFLPLYFWHLGVMWATPVIVYLTALVLKFVSLSEIAIRIPSVVVGLVNVALVWFLTLRVLNSQKYALLAAFLLATTPVHFIQSRILLDNHFIVPFVIGWLIFLWLFIQAQRRQALLIQTNKFWYLAASTFLLGLGVHSYHAAKIMMPLYFLLTVWIVWDRVSKDKKLALVALVSFLLPLVPLAFWLSQYPDTLVDQIKYTKVYDVGLGTWSGAKTLLAPQSLSHRVDVYINYFNPKFLFLRGDQSLIHSTHKAGVFLLPLFVFIPVGIYKMAKGARFDKLVVLGFFTAPIAATVAGDHFRISRALVILPFAILLAVHGVRWFMARHKWAGFLLLGVAPFQFLYFLYDYFTDYRIRSYSWMNSNIPGALEGVIASDGQNPIDGIYFDKTIDFLPSYWKFYTTKHNRTELLTRTEYFDPKFTEVDSLPADSLLVYSHHNVDGQKQTLGPFRKLSPVFEPDGTQKFYLYRN